MVKEISIPVGVEVVPMTRPKTWRVLRFRHLLGFFVCFFVLVQSFKLLTSHNTFLAQVTCGHHHHHHCHHHHHRRHELRAICKSIRTPAGPPQSFCTATRTENDRFVPGTPPVLLRNATIWTGARNGTEVVYGDVLLDKGLVVAVGYIPPNLLESVGRPELTVLDVGGAWVTPGLVDLHSHLGVESAPSLAGKCDRFHFCWNDDDFSSGSQDGNSFKAPILPWLRSIDGLNTHDAGYELAIAGGVTTAQILPGSADNIGELWSKEDVSTCIL